ncbi:hypothetical protein [Roseiterribacter gracilis]|uniref:Uncharacterized protein n=1 Tax=Roseiterribacter gracilis TaxID=2812848 RepID=A0A8S8XFN0_9PROT|nr:hypothetical protein TMPK1_36610 [Rhodospirillales bacterium TMPK1]
MIKIILVIALVVILAIRATWRARWLNRTFSGPELVEYQERSMTYFVEPLQKKLLNFADTAWFILTAVLIITVLASVYLRWIRDDGEKVQGER